MSLADGSCGQFAGGSYILAAGGTTYRVVLNAFSLPSEIFWASSHVAFAWNADLSQVTAIIDEGASSEMHDYNVRGFSAARVKIAALAAPDEGSRSIEVRVPQEASAAESGVVSESAGAVAEPTERTAQGEPKEIIATFQNTPPFRDINDYLEFLGRQALAYDSVGEFMRQEMQNEGREPTPLESVLFDVLNRIGDLLTNIADHQENACLPCTAACGLGCYGACRIPAAGLTVCVVRRSTECLPPNTFTLGAGCLEGDSGACCLRRFNEPRGCRTLGSLACLDEGGRFYDAGTCDTAACTPGGACCLGDYDCRSAFDRPDCEAISARSGAASFTFYEDTTCAELAARDLCNQGVCCYPDGSYNCDYRTEDDCRRSGREGAYFAHGPCEAATCR